MANDRLNRRNSGQSNRISRIPPSLSDWRTNARPVDPPAVPLLPPTVMGGGNDTAHNAHAQANGTNNGMTYATVANNGHAQAQAQAIAANNAHAQGYTNAAHNGHTLGYANAVVNGHAHGYANIGRRSNNKPRRQGNAGRVYRNNRGPNNNGRRIGTNAHAHSHIAFVISHDPHVLNISPLRQPSEARLRIIRPRWSITQLQRMARHRCIQTNQEPAQTNTAPQDTNASQEHANATSGPETNESDTNAAMPAQITLPHTLATQSPHSETRSRAANLTRNGPNLQLSREQVPINRRRGFVQDQATSNPAPDRRVGVNGPRRDAPSRSPCRGGSTSNAAVSKRRTLPRTRQSDDGTITVDSEGRRPGSRFSNAKQACGNKHNFCFEDHFNGEDDGDVGQGGYAGANARNSQGNSSEAHGTTASSGHDTSTTVTEHTSNDGQRNSNKRQDSASDSTDIGKWCDEANCKANGEFTPEHARTMFILMSFVKLQNDLFVEAITGNLISLLPAGATGEVGPANNHQATNATGGDGPINNNTAAASAEGDGAVNNDNDTGGTEEDNLGDDMYV